MFSTTTIVALNLNIIITTKEAIASENSLNSNQMWKVIIFLHM